ncbi:MAG: small acid-soluble spore protein SspI [Bacilli bacterium]|nr:small acid-soluble spore protein SspI [Bacilli bacterium]
MDNISIRSHIIENFKNDSLEEIKNAVKETVSSLEDEELLPGLGVFFSLIYEEADEEMKEKMITLIKQGLEKKEKA